MAASFSGSRANWKLLRALRALEIHGESLRFWTETNWLKRLRALGTNAEFGVRKSPHPDWADKNPKLLCVFALRYFWFSF